MAKQKRKTWSVQEKLRIVPPAAGEPRVLFGRGFRRDAFYTNSVRFDSREGSTLEQPSQAVDRLQLRRHRPAGGRARLPGRQRPGRPERSPGRSARRFG